jgi:DNA-binding CsgD family transcriptional regulator
MDEEVAAATGLLNEPCCCDSPHFTMREVEIMLLVAAGSDTDKVASALCMSPHTATHHLGNMLRRSGSSNRTELIARAYASGILVPGLWPPRWSGRFCLRPSVSDGQARSCNRR